MPGMRSIKNYSQNSLINVSLLQLKRYKNFLENVCQQILNLAAIQNKQEVNHD